MTYANAEERDLFIAGLRDLATFIESNQDVPVPKYTTTVYVFPPNGSDPERRAEVDAAASLLFTEARTTLVGHYEASRFFGPMEYKVVAIPRENLGNSEGEPE